VAIVAFDMKHKARNIEQRNEIFVSTKGGVMLDPFADGFGDILFI
jgi:hypothetical protein